MSKNTIPAEQTPPEEVERLLNQIRARHKAAALVNPDQAEWPCNLHLGQACYQLGKMSEAILSDSPSQIRHWALELAVSGLSAAARVDRGEDPF